MQFQRAGVTWALIVLVIVTCTQYCEAGSNKFRSNISPRVDPRASSPQFTSNCTCGERYTSGRIVGGEVTAPLRYPWQVALVLTGNQSIHCGASLINDYYVLTAASCVQNMNSSQLTAKLMVHNLTNPNLTNVITANVSQIIPHSKFNSTSMKHDIALLRLSQAVTWPSTPNLRPICLPSVTNMTYEGDKALVIGWGRTTVNGTLSNVLSQVPLRVLNETECESRGYTAKQIKNSLMICAAGKSTKKVKGTCDGDNGGPFMYRNADNLYEQIGVATFGLGCSAGGRPSVFTRVTKHLHWIKVNTQNATYCSGFSFP